MQASESIKSTPSVSVQSFRGRGGGRGGYGRGRELGKPRDLSGVTCFSCMKTGHYRNACPEARAKSTDK